MKGFLKLTQVHLKLFLREPAAFFFTLMFPTMLLLLFGAIFGNGNKPIEQFNGYGMVDLLTGGLLLVKSSQELLNVLPYGVPIMQRPVRLITPLTETARRLVPR